MSALAYGCTGFDGIICTSFDARRNMLYNAMFRVWGGRVERLCEDRQSSAEEVATEVVSTASALGCKVMLVGDGSDVLASFLEESGLSVVSDSRGVKASDIISAVNAGDYTCHSSSTLVPEYLRPSQAERERNERLSKKS
jgi:tRNA threonylcarbamoyladenosine biosynthesis protein TsaB